MAEFIRLSSRIINLSSIREVVLAYESLVVHWHNGQKTVLSGLDASVLLEALEYRYGVMTASAARLWDEFEAESATTSHIAAAQGFGIESDKESL